VHVPVTSRPYLFIPLHGPVDPNSPGYVTEIALVTDDGHEPADADYHAALCIGGEPCILFGPGAPFSYATGWYMAYARLTAGAERLVLEAGRVRIGTPAEG
jgi:hypothetical protein